MSHWQLHRDEVLDEAQLRHMLDTDPGTAAQAILTAAKADIPEAQALLGQILLDGRGIERDPALAVTWFKIAASRSHAMAFNMLGRCHEHGWGCEVNAYHAAGYYRQAAEMKLDWGLYNYGNLLATGRGVAANSLQAFECYRVAAEMGHAKSMNLLGRYLEEGIACTQDVPAAYQWYRRSAEGGDFRGQFSHAAVLAAQGNYEQAIGWLSVALQSGNLKFLRTSALSLAHASTSVLQAQALGFFERAAEIGDDSDQARYETYRAQHFPP